jgi:L-lactate dehydrogenase
MNSNPQLNKVSIVGCGRVGMTAAYSLLQSGLINELVLFGRHKADLIGEQLDLEHGMSFIAPCQVTATDQYSDLAKSDVVIVTAGASQKPGQTRLDLISTNVGIIKSIIPEVIAAAPEAVILIVSNPVDILTTIAYQVAGLPKGRIFGSGTTLDTARFRFHLSEFLNVNPKSIHAYILGEHGDSSFPVFSSALVGGQPMEGMNNYSEVKGKRAFEKAQAAAYKIIESKGSTYYAIGTAVTHIVKAILQDAHTVMPVSIPLHNYYGHSGVALSVPCVIGRNGVEQTLETRLSWEEKEKLTRSVKTLKSYL